MNRKDKLHDQLRSRRGALLEVARRAGVTRSAVSRCLAGEFVSANIRGAAEAVAREIKSGTWKREAA